MSIQVNILGNDYTLPTQGTNPPWGQDLSDIIQALISVANTTIGPSDILTTSFSINNNVASPTNIVGASFDISSVRSFIISYSIYRNSTITETSEVGQILGTYKSVAGTWELAQTNAGISGVTFTMTNSGQLQYVSTNFSGTSYSGKLKFKASAFLQA